VVVQENEQEVVEQGQVLVPGVNIGLSDFLLAPDVHCPAEQQLA